MTDNRIETEISGNDGRFKPGNPGKPKGARSRATMAAEALLNGEAEALTRRAVELALEGDTVALRLCLERIAPARKDTPIRLDLPKVRSAADAVEASSAVLEALAEGEITPAEAASVMAILSAHKGIVETGDLERRIEALEKEGK